MERHIKAEVSAQAVGANMVALGQLLGPATKFCAVVKSNCYGLGLGNLLAEITNRADSLAVATPAEAIELRDMGWSGEILLLLSSVAYCDDLQNRRGLAELIEREITITLASPSDVPLVAAAAERLGATAKVHVKIDTGMHRGGIGQGEAPELVRQARSRSNLALGGIYTHFACADEKDLSFTRHQLDRFLETVGMCGRRVGLTVHAANSAATIRLPSSHLDMVRSGIAIYGYQPSEQSQAAIALRPALRLSARLMQVKEVSAGGRCGYGLTHTFGRDGQVGLVPVGYGDGYLRSLSNKATMRIRGKDVPVVGRVSMNQTIVDLTDVLQARAGDEVEIISNDPAAPHSVENLASLAGTISYELITGLAGATKFAMSGDS